MSNKTHTPSSDFAKEIALIPGGEVINKCIQCGICTASCVVACVDDQYRPRRLIQKILIGKRDEVLKSDQPWLCMTCRMCEERCQEGVSPAEIFHAVRVLAVKEGHIPKVFQITVEKVLCDGWMLADAYTDFNEDEREDLGLNPVLAWNDTFTKKVKKKYLVGEESA